MFSFFATTFPLFHHEFINYQTVNLPPRVTTVLKTQFSQPTLPNHRAVENLVVVVVAFFLALHCFNFHLVIFPA